jgi:hypothetical protein
MSLRTWICIATGCIVVASCTREQVPHGKYVGSCSSLDLTSIPIVLVGRITSDRKVGRPERVTHDHSLAIYQWFKVSVNVENVLKGNIPSQDVDIYYLTNIGPIGGPHRLGLRASVPGGTWQIGDRELFFLRWDQTFLRPVCDISRTAVWQVYTGAHQTPKQPLPKAIIDILLNPGSGATDQDMVKAMVRSLPYGLAKDQTIEKLQQLAATAHPIVRRQACEILTSMGEPCSRSSR